MEKRYAMLIVLIIGGLAWYFVTTRSTPVTPAPVIVEQPGLAPESPKAQKDNLIIVDKPLPNSSVRSPLLITGMARGNWFFEGSFPVEITDANGDVLKQHYAQAKGDWMTTEFVPFTSEISFDATGREGTYGYVVLRKDNPSGEPEFDNALSFRIRF